MSSVSPVAKVSAEQARSWRRGIERRGDNITINIQHADLSSDRDIQQTARKLAHYTALERRRLGLS